VFLKVNGERADLKSLEVTVHAARLEYPTGALFPIPDSEGYIPYDGITERDLEDNLHLLRRGDNLRPPGQ